MNPAARVGLVLLAATVLAAAQDNPYRPSSTASRCPRDDWGSTSAVEIDRDGRSIWVGERCGANTCLDRATGQMSSLPSILKFDPSGKLVASFGQGMLIFPHGIHVDRDGNVWVTDGQDDAPQTARAAAGARCGAAAGQPGPRRRVRSAAGIDTRSSGVQVQPARQAADDARQGGRRGRAGLLLSAERRARRAERRDLRLRGTRRRQRAHPEVHEGREVHQVVREEGQRSGRDGAAARAGAWTPAAGCSSATARNNRIQIFDQDGKLLDTWPQFSRPSGIYIDANDMIYVADSESESVSRNHDGWKRGIRIGSAKDGKVLSFIPDPWRRRPARVPPKAWLWIAQGNVYGAEVGPRGVKKYVKKYVKK